MGGLSNSEVNASIRGYILRSLVKGYNFSLSAKTLANKMQANGLISAHQTFQGSFITWSMDII